MVPIYFDPNGHRWRDQIDVVFDFMNPSTSEKFSIIRQISGVSGVLADLDQLKPIEPYQEPDRIRSDPVIGAVAPKKKPSRQRPIPWAVPFKEYLISPAVLEVLDQDYENPLELMQAIRAFLPPHFLQDPTTLKRYWSTLIHIEEAKLMSVSGLPYKSSFSHST